MAVASVFPHRHTSLDLIPFESLPIDDPTPRILVTMLQIKVTLRSGGLGGGGRGANAPDIGLREQQHIGV